MPKIQAVRIKNKLVPIDQISFQDAYQCPKTHRVFASKESYMTYLRNSRSALHARILRDRKIAKLHDCADFDSIIQWVTDNSAFYLNLARFKDSYRDEKYPNADKFRVKITYLNVNYGQVSNSHHCPKNGVTNCGGIEGKPRSYPGWEGRIEFEYSHDLPGFNWDAMSALGIFTGTGGGSGKNSYGFDVRFFEADWTGLSKSIIFDLIKDPKYVSRYNYGEPRYFRI